MPATIAAPKAKRRAEARRLEKPFEI